MTETGKRNATLDGLRGLAILLVIGCHAALPHMQDAGGVGVAVFFVLSGFLITSQLLGRERVDFRGFWVRRARRLLPALLVMLGALFPVFLLAGWSAHAYWGDVRPALLYYANFHEMHGWTQPFGHLWSLSVEEQFYVAFPVIVAALRCRPGAVLAFSAVGFVVSATARVWLSLDPSSVMHAALGVDTNAYALLLGAGIAAAVAMGWRPRHQSARFAAGAVLVGVPAALPPIPVFYAAVVPAAIGSALMLTAGLAPGRLAPMEAAPLRFCGRLSYGWYLWQGPLLALTWPTTTVGHTAGKLLVCAAALGVAWLSYRFVEQPFLQRRSGVSVEADSVQVYAGSGADIQDDRAGVRARRINAHLAEGAV